MAAVIEPTQDATAPAVAGIVIYVNPDLQRLRDLVAASRARLAELESVYTSEKASVSALQARLFKRLRSYFEKRDRIRLIVKYRQTFLDTLLREGEEEAENVRQQYQEADAHTKREYAETEKVMATKRELSNDEEAEIKMLWKRLVKLFHPDRYENEPDKVESYQRLTAAINAAKDDGDLETLRRIADDPAGFVLRQGWTGIDFGDIDELDKLRRLWESLEAEVIGVIETTAALRESAEYELCQITKKKPEVFERVVEQQVEAINGEISAIESDAAELNKQIAELTGGASAITS